MTLIKDSCISSSRTANQNRINRDCYHDSIVTAQRETTRINVSDSVQAAHTMIIEDLKRVPRDPR